MKKENIPRTPMLRNKHIIIPLNIGLQALENLHAPTALLKDMGHTLSLQTGCGVLPAGQETRLVLLMQTVVDRDFMSASGIDEGSQMNEGVARGERVGDQRVYLSGRVEEVIVGVD
jgi:hypothetical protein